ncbi:cyclase family protein, partial [Parasphingorhabdus sp.]
MSLPRIWDISQRLGTTTPIWPGEPDLELSQHAEIGPECPVNVGAISFPLHAGTHADAPLHYSNDGVASADSSLAAYIGPCVVTEVRRANGRVEVADCDWTAIEGAHRVLFRTYDSFPHARWDE